MGVRYFEAILTCPITMVVNPTTTRKLAQGGPTRARSQLTIIRPVEPISMNITSGREAIPLRQSVFAAAK